jgi:hypothetical protein
MEISLQYRFKSPPDVVRRALVEYVQRKFPKASKYVAWDPDGTRASGKKMGVSGTLELRGEGPTVVDLSGRVGFPASLTVTERQIRSAVDEAFRDLQSVIP